MEKKQKDNHDTSEDVPHEDPLHGYNSDQNKEVKETGHREATDETRDEDDNNPKDEDGVGEETPERSEDTTTQENEEEQESEEPKKSVIKRMKEKMVAAQVGIHWERVKKVDQKDKEHVDEKHVDQKDEETQVEEQVRLCRCCWLCVNFEIQTTISVNFLKTSNTLSVVRLLPLAKILSSYQ